MSPQISYGGKIHKFPDSFTEADISKALQAWEAEQQTGGRGAGAGAGQITPAQETAAVAPGEAGYFQQVLDRVRAMGSGLYGAFKAGDLPAMAGLTGLEEQYGRIVPESKTVSEWLINLAPFVGPSINQIIAASAQGRPKEAAAIGTTDILPMLLGAQPIPSRIMPKSIPKALERSAGKSYARMLEPTSQLRVGVAEQVGPQLAKEKIVAASRKSMIEKMRAGKERVGPQTATAFAQAPAVDVSAWVDALEKVKDRHLYIRGTKITPSYKAPLEKLFKGIEDDLMGLADPQGNVPAQLLDNYVDDLNKGLVSARKDFAEVAPASRKQITKSAAAAYRQILDASYPPGQQINALYSMYAKAENLLEFSRRARVAAESAVKTGSSKGFGAAIQRILPGPARRIPFAISAIFDSVPFNTASGALKQSLAEALAAGNFEGAQKIAMGFVLTQIPQARKD